MKPATLNPNKIWRLSVVTVGTGPLGSTHPDGPKRLQYFAPEDANLGPFLKNAGFRV